MVCTAIAYNKIISRLHGINKDEYGSDLIIALYWANERPSGHPGPLICFTGNSNLKEGRKISGTGEMEIYNFIPDEHMNQYQNPVLDFCDGDLLIRNGKCLEF